MTLLAGKVALITGGSRGLGWEMARGYAAAGAHVIMASRKQSACEAKAAEIKERFGVDALGIACNVSDWAQCDQLVELSYDHFGKVDVLVNNAGLSPLYSTVDGIDESLFDKVMAVNLKGPFRLTAAIGTRMVAAGGGSIINVSSIEAIRPSATAVPYSCAKAGLNAMTVAMSKALAPTVRVNAIQAGPFLTDISKAWDMSEFQKAADTTIALRRGGQPHEIVGAAVYFASDESSFCTGSILRLDGGVS